jgi:hypothetical protein
MPQVEHFLGRLAMEVEHHSLGAPVGRSACPSHPGTCFLSLVAFLTALHALRCSTRQPQQPSTVSASAVSCRSSRNTCSREAFDDDHTVTNSSVQRMASFAPVQQRHSEDLPSCSHSRSHSLLVGMCMTAWTYGQELEGRPRPCQPAPVPLTPVPLSAHTATALQPPGRGSWCFRVPYWSQEVPAAAAATWSIKAHHLLCAAGAVQPNMIRHAAQAVTSCSRPLSSRAPGPAAAGCHHNQPSNVMGTGGIAEKPQHHLNNSSSQLAPPWVFGRTTAVPQLTGCSGGRSHQQRRCGGGSM